MRDPGWRIDTSAGETDAAWVDDQLHRFNLASAPLDQVRPLRVMASAAGGKRLGGAVGRSWGECCELQQIAVDESERRRGIGRAVMAAFEAEARLRGCRLIYLDTFSFQAAPFYERLGYLRVHSIEGFAPGVVKHTYEKRLDEA
ncbi:GNAT family N-acetyltransferase [Caldimonas sp. KR1-144]|uniref:GNAT family N-acetyltransferase n=1 Tax=Caldimonas sp. KR1-144 TaxID=3400911 RepID=UPI003C082F93